MEETTIETRDWPHKKDVVFLINPAKRKRVLAGLAVIGAVALFVLSGEAERLLKAQSVKADRDALSMQMHTLADAGKPEAALWLAMNYPTENYRIEALAKQGNPHALYLQGMQKIKSGDKASGEQLLAQAASEGYPDAVRHQLKIHN